MILIPNYAHTPLTPKKQPTPSKMPKPHKWLERGQTSQYILNAERWGGFLHLFLMFVMVITNQSQITNLPSLIWDYLLTTEFRMPERLVQRLNIRHRSHLRMMCHWMNYCSETTSLQAGRQASVLHKSHHYEVLTQISRTKYHGVLTVFLN